MTLVIFSRCTMEMERAMTLYDEAPVHSMKPSLSTVDLEHLQLESPMFNSWLSADELPRRTELDECRRPPPQLPTQLPAVTPINPVVPLVVEAKAAEEDDERSARLPSGRRERVRATTSSQPSVHGPPYAFNPAAAVGPMTTAAPGYRSSSFVPVSVCVPKDEPQTVPCVAAVAAAADTQKLVRKRERNRLAAQKCRQRKLEQIGMLQERVEKLNGVKVELERTVEILRRKLGIVSHHYRQHVDAGCPLAPLRP